MYELLLQINKKKKKKEEHIKTREGKGLGKILKSMNFWKFK